MTWSVSSCSWPSVPVVSVKVEEGGHDVTLQQQLVHTDDIPRTRIVDACYKDLYELSYNGCIGFSTKLKLSG